MHLNCAYYYCDNYDDVIPVFDIPVYIEVVLASMHPKREYEPATGPARSASSASWARTNNGRGMVTAAIDIGRSVQQLDGGAAGSMRTMNALNL